MIKKIDINELVEHTRADKKNLFSVNDYVIYYKGQNNNEVKYSAPKWWFLKANYDDNLILRKIIKRIKKKKQTYTNYIPPIKKYIFSYFTGRCPTMEELENENKFQLSIIKS